METDKRLIQEYLVKEIRQTKKELDEITHKKNQALNKYNNSKKNQEEKAQLGSTMAHYFSTIRKKENKLKILTDKLDKQK